MFSFRSLVSYVSLGLVLLSAGASAQRYPPELCSSGVHVIAVRGHGPGDPFNVLIFPVSNITSRIPGSTFVGLPYNSASEDQVAGTIQGTTMLKQYIMDHVDSCPHTKIALIGYSEGAIIVNNMACGSSVPMPANMFPLDSKYAKYLIAVMTYGDEAHLPFMPWNKGTCPEGQGILPRYNPAACMPYLQSMASWCDHGDPYCCAPWDYNDAHHKYVPNYDNAVGEFTLARFKSTPPL